MLPQPKYPIYIPTKGRWETPYTIRAFEKIGVPFKAVVEPQQAEDYAAIVGANNLLILPHLDKGLVITRNWIWDHAQASGTPYFWTFDDNIDGFFRFNHGKRIAVIDGTFLRIAEDFTERFANVLISGFQYWMFGVTSLTRAITKPFLINTRIYSNMLIKTDACNPSGHPYRNEGFYNDDTDLCLRMLKDGNCTILFYAFLVRKRPTMTIKGGMTPHYQGDGRYKMALELQRKHPDVVKITRKWGRWQHQVDYRPFKANRLIRKPGIIIPDEPNEYGMRLVKIDDYTGKTSEVIGD